MAIKYDTVTQCLEWSRCDIDTLLYAIALDGADSMSEWENDAIVELIMQASKAIGEAEGRADQETIALDLGSALEKIYGARDIFDKRERRRAKKPAAPKLVASNG